MIRPLRSRGSLRAPLAGALAALSPMGCLPAPPGPEDTAPEVIHGVCEPHPLECGSCSFADDRADRDGLERVYRCRDGGGELGSGREFDAVMRTDPASLHDIHYYDPGSGRRVAAQRIYDLHPGACRDIDDEWWGEVLDCAPVCEHEALPLTDDALPRCD